MLSFRSRFGRRVKRRLSREQIVWLTTVDSRNIPQPRPVWFHWDGESLLVYSQKHTAKLRHIARHSSVALNFNTDEEGGDVTVLLADARILRQSPPPERVKAYLRKYRGGIKDLGMTIPEFQEAYPVAIVITPRVMRGF